MEAAKAPKTISFKLPSLPKKSAVTKAPLKVAAKRSATKATVKKAPAKAPA